MELQQLRAFLVIARTGNLTQASRDLFASQPAVSAQLKSLEDELGVMLFERSHRGMKLTAAGGLLLPKVREICEGVAELSALAVSLSTTPPTLCRLGLNTTAGVLRVPQLVAALRDTAPRLRLELHQGHSSRILDEISRDQLDAGFYFGTCSRPEVSHRLVTQLDLAVVGPVSSRQRLKDAPLEALLVESWVLPPEDCAFFARTLQLFQPSGATTPQGVVADDEATMLHLVQESVGIALLPTFMVDDDDAVAVIRHTPLKVELGIAWRESTAAAAPVRLLLEAVAQVFR